MRHLSVKNIKEDLENGLTRFKKDDFGYGSIEEKYNLSKTQVTQIFKDPRLKGTRVKGKPRKSSETIILVDDFNTETVTESVTETITTSEAVQQQESTNVE